MWQTPRLLIVPLRVGSLRSSPTSPMVRLCGFTAAQLSCRVGHCGVGARRRYGAGSAQTTPASPPTPTSGLMPFQQGSVHYEWSATCCGEQVLSVQQGKTTRKRLRQVGMPTGYPVTVAAGYQSFFYFSMASTFVSNFSSSIGYQTLLGGFFLESSPQLWMLKDLYPAIVATYFANRVVSYEKRPKFWFMVSVLLYNGTVIADMLIPSVLSNHMLLAAVCTSILKQSSALMFLVTRASALQHFAVDNNLAELTKKFNSYGMVIYTVATAAGIGFCTLVPSFEIQMSVAVLCVLINLVLAPLSLKSIRYRILNFASITVLLSTYLKENKVLTTSEVSTIHGLRMKPSAEMHGNGIMLVSPPLQKLVINSSTLRNDILFVNQKQTFLLGLFEKSIRFPKLGKAWEELKDYCAKVFMSRKKKAIRDHTKQSGFNGKRLVLLVQKDCPPQDIFTAYLIMFTAVLEHGQTAEELSTFIRECSGEENIWNCKGSEFREKLRGKCWDVDLPALDNPNFRLSSLFHADQAGRM